MFQQYHHMEHQKVASDIVPMCGIEPGLSAWRANTFTAVLPQRPHDKQELFAKSVKKMTLCRSLEDKLKCYDLILTTWYEKADPQTHIVLQYTRYTCLWTRNEHAYDDGESQRRLTLFLSKTCSRERDCWGMCEKYMSNDGFYFLLSGQAWGRFYFWVCSMIQRKGDSVWTIVCSPTDHYYVLCWCLYNDIYTQLEGTLTSLFM